VTRFRSIGVLAALLATLAAVATACGGSSGGGGSSGSAVGIVPGDAIAFITVDTDTSSSQLKSAEAVLDEFPFHTKLMASLEKSLASSDNANARQLINSVGPELDVAILKVNGKTTPVGFTKPNDSATFTAALKNAKSEQISGWTVFSTTQAALDAVQNRTSNLSDDAGYKAASKTLSGDSLVTAFAGQKAFSLAVPLATKAGASKLDVTPGALANVSKLNWLTADATSHDSGIEVDVHANTVTSAPSGSGSSLSGEIPGGVLAAAAFNSSGSLSKLSSGALTGASGTAISAQVQKTLGVSLQDIVQAVNGPGILYLKAGLPLPEITIAVKPADAQQAERTVGTLIGKLTKGTKPTSVTVDGVTLQSVSIGPVTIYYGVWDGQLILTDSQTAVGELQSKDNRLADDDNYKAAAKASGLPSSASTWLYIDLKDTIPAVESLVGLAGQKLPPNVGPNLQPLQSFVAYGSADGNTSTAALFLQAN
jgi:hypothetical protein